MPVYLHSYPICSFHGRVNVKAMICVVVEKSNSQLLSKAKAKYSFITATNQSSSLKEKYNNRHQKCALWALDSQQVARVCGGRYVALK